jgi:hypothetical protein
LLRAFTGFIWLRRGTSEHSDEPSVLVRCWEILLAEEYLATEEGLCYLGLVKL